MKRKRILVFLMLFLFMFANTVFATNWVYYNNFSEGRSYIDTETVYRSGNTLYFWELAMYDKDTYDGWYLAGDRVTIKYEVKLTNPRTMRELEFHDYDSNNVEFWSGNTPTNWWTVNSGSFDDGLINLALKYAR